jgi:hypothetical protein
MAVYVYLWFDIEDYITKESDGLILEAGRILQKYKIPVTCKVVAQKVRALQAHGRRDVIAAISRYDVGYHLDTHSRHPTLYEYLANENVIDGAADFRARESEGLRFVRDVFKRNPSCFGHPGSAWVPHVYPALKQMGIPLYLDETAILNLNNAPYWYCGVLNLNGANKNFILFDRSFEDPEGIHRLKARFKRIHDGLKNEGGFVSILFHLHTAINKKFWDEVNFGSGKNRDAADYVRPPAQPRRITDRAWKDFDEFIGYVSSFEDVQFITARDASRMLRRPDIVEIHREELRNLAESSRARIDYVQVRDYFLSPAQIFYAVTSALKEYKNSGRVPARLIVREYLGPMKPWSSKTTSRMGLTAGQLLRACERAADFIDSKGFMPDTIELAAGAQLSPADFLSTASSALVRLLRTGSMSHSVTISKANFMGTRRVHADRFRRACEWAVLPPNFSAPRILEQIKLQTWTLVPAGAPKALSRRTT